ncbi:hypothetical protein KPL70_004857 [Citrus sinensis]|uniref:Uncharacterized protein n=1 Tax=Citrus sinensis TaxID=2711 RepID=A0ACB8NEP4_CITSI|nr:hypothetical protein KPL70_004857 [Citrus sinensis]KAH9796236.1 hypothetical protein KPL71_005459 [Citrus sinensis]
MASNQTNNQLRVPPRDSNRRSRTRTPSFLTWSKYTPFSYEFVQDYDAADVKISFQRGDHGDGYPFDGPGPYNLLAHSFPPTDGRFHYDGDENWTVGAVPGAVDMQTVALHELRHVLGLAHRP